MLGRAFQTCNLKNKNCSELLLANGMGLDRAPIEFQKLVFLKPPTGHLQSSPKIIFVVCYKSAIFMMAKWKRGSLSSAVFWDVVYFVDWLEGVLLSEQQFLGLLSLTHVLGPFTCNPWVPMACPLLKHACTMNIHPLKFLQALYLQAIGQKIHSICVFSFPTPSP